jgi:hypothetical protein
MKQYETIDFNNVVKDISCVKLESENVPVFDLCRRMILYGNYFYIMTVRNEVFIYDKSGKFINQITFGRDVLFLTTLIIKNDRLWVFSNFNILNKYKTDGTFISKETLPFSCTDIIETNDRDFLVYDGHIGSWDHAIALTDMSSIHKFFLHKARRDKSGNTPQSMYAPDTNTGDIYILCSRNDTVYQYNPNKEELKPYYHLNFKGDFLTENMYPKGGFSDKEMSEIIERHKYIHAIYSFHWVSDKLFFKLTNKREDFCVINMKDNSLQSFNLLFDGYAPAAYNPFAGSDGRTLYCLVREDSLVKHYQQNECTYSAIRQLLPSLRENGMGWILLAIEINQ